MDQDAFEFANRRIAATPVVGTPFPYQYVHPVFPEPYYRRLLGQLPPTDQYVALGETGTLTSKSHYPERLVVEIPALAKRERAAGGGGFWDAFSAWILGTEFTRLLLECYRPWVAQRFGEGATIATVSQARLVRDLTNYALGPHTDQPFKLLSLLLYLPQDDARPQLGTAVYEPLEAGFRCAGGPHHPFERFRRVRTMPYVPNALFLFFKNDSSFHGVERVDEPRVERNAIQFNVYVKDAAAAGAAAA